MTANAVLLYSLNYRPELTGIGKYNTEFLESLASQGEDVEVVCGTPYYPEWQVHPGYSNKTYSTRIENGVRVNRCPLYVPRNPTTLRRILHLITFALTSALPLLSSCLRRRPKVLMVVQPTLFCTPMALLVSKLLGIKSVLHVQDFELDAMFGLSMGAGKQGWLAKLAYRVERRLLRAFDAVSTISHSMLARAEEKGVDPARLLFFPNWSDTDFVRPGTDNSELRQRWGLNPGQKVVLYAGNIGAKQGLELVLDSAEHFLSRDDVRFLVVGSGAHRESLEREARRRGLNNVEFKSLLPWSEVPAMLTLADVHLVVQKRGVADAVLPSKLTNILSAGGHAVVTAEPDTELGRLAQQHPGIYSCVEPEQRDSFIAALETELNRADEAGYNEVARRYAELNLNQQAVLRRFEADLDLLIGGSIRTTSENG